MKKESNIRTRRAVVKARERQKKKLMFLGGASIVLVILLVIVGFLFQDQEKKYEADENTLFLLEDGKVISVTVETFDESVYDQTELEAYIEELIASYHEENGEGLITQKSVAVEGNVANLVVEYANVQVYEEFEGVELFDGTLSEALKAGYTFDGTYAKVTGQKPEEVSAVEFLETLDYNVVVIKANTKVEIDGEICYVSVENTQSVGSNWVSIKDGSMLEMTALETESLGGTETEGGDEVVTDDELVAGSDSTEVIFDFGDEEEIEDVDQYSDVYTYIIYK